MIYVAVFNGLILLRYSLMRMVSLRGQLYAPLLATLFLFSAFRFEVGCDWTGYLNQFYVYGSLNFAESLVQREGLWTSLFVFQNWLGLPYPWINVFSSLIFFYGVHVLARRQPDALAFLILLFPILIINMPMSGIRQGAAIGMMCIAFAAFIDRSLWRFVLMTVLASLLHSSAIVFLLLAPMVTGNYSRQRLFLSLLLVIPGALVLMSGEAAEVATSRYIGTGVDAAGAAFRVGLLMLTAVFFLLFLKRKWATTFPDDFKLVMIGALMMAAMFVLVPISSVIGDRLGYYLVPIQAMIFARIPFLPIRQNRAVYVALPYLGLLTVFVVWTSLSGHFQQCYLPYQTWLFGYPEFSGAIFEF
jgi:hypothetical protein